MSNKVLIIGIDGGTWDVLKPAMDAGFMPNLCRFTQSGASSPLSSVIPAITLLPGAVFKPAATPARMVSTISNIGTQMAQDSL